MKKCGTKKCKKKKCETKNSRRKTSWNLNQTLRISILMFVILKLTLLFFFMYTAKICIPELCAIAEGDHSPAATSWEG